MTFDKISQFYVMGEAVMRSRILLYLGTASALLVGSLAGGSGTSIASVQTPSAQSAIGQGYPVAPSSTESSSIKARPKPKPKPAVPQHDNPGVKAHRLQVSVHSSPTKVPARRMVRALATPTAPFSECPAVNADTSCGILINVIGSNNAQILQDSSQGPYDGSDDTLIGVINNSSVTVNSFSMSSDTDLFGFDQDGICSGYVPGPPSCPYGPTGYEGPGTSFSNISANSSGGTVNFSGGLAPGATAYFSLEEALSATTVFTGGPTVGEQGNAPNPSEHITTCFAKLPVNCATGDFIHQFSDVSIPGRGPALSLQRTYSSSGAAIDGPFGFGWQDSYNLSMATDVNGFVTISQENGSTVTFNPDGAGGFVAPPRVLGSLVANGDGTFMFTRRPSQEKFVFSASGQLLSESDLNGNTTVLTYSGGLLATATDPSGRTLNFSYTGARIHQVTDPLGRVTTYAYDSAGDLTGTTDPVGRSWTFGYDASHLLTSMTDPRGGVVTNVYDTSARVIRQTDAVGLSTTWAYNGDPASSAGSITTMTDEHGNVTVYSYANLELGSVTHASGSAASATTSYTYDAATLGHATVTDPNGNVTTNTYDADGNLTSTTDPMGNTTSSTFDGLDQMTSLTSPLGETATWQYDGSSNLTSTTDPMGNTATYVHGDASHPGDVTSVTDPDGRTKTLTYDAYGDVSSTSTSPTNGVTNTTTYQYDVAGELVCQVSGNATAAGVSCPAIGASRAAKTSTTVYDSDGEVTSTTDPNGHTTSSSYDTNGNRTSTTDAAGNVSTNTYDADNRVVTTVTGANGAAPSTSRESYDLTPGASGCATGVVAGTSYCATKTDPNGHVTVEYFGARDELLAELRPGNQTTRYTHDLDGNLTATIDAAGRITAQQYDADNHLLATTYSDGFTPNVVNTYDNDGRRSSMSDGTGQSSYSYDADGRLTSTTDGSGAIVGYTFDGAGNVTTLTYPNGQSVHRSYDGASELTAVTDWLGNTTAYSYDSDGNLTQTHLGNGDITTSKFDDADQMNGTSVATSSATVLASIGYARSASGSITQEADAGALTGTTNYSYNGKNQLTAANAAAFSYDGAGNPTTVSGVGQQFNSADELTSTASSAYGYDAIGDRTSTKPSNGPTSKYAYDQAQRLTNVYVGSGFAPLTPARITDTRKGSGMANAGRTLGAGQTLTVQVTGVGGVPAGATAALLNVTVTNTTKAGYLTVWPAGQPRPTASDLNWTPRQTVPNLVEVPLSSSGTVSIFNSAGTTDVVVDVQGYHALPTGASSGLYRALTPARICDTRSGQPLEQCNASGQGKLVGPVARVVSVAGLGGVPTTTATAVVLNITVTGTSTAGYLTVWPNGQPRPTASNLNWIRGETVPNRVVVPIGAGGKIELFNSSGSTDVIVDVAGYFTATSGSVFTPVTPTRICDTRAGGCGINGASAAPIKPGGVLRLALAGSGSIPANVTAVVLNVTVTNTRSSSYLTVYPDGHARPLASDLNWTPKTTVPNLVVATVGTDGKVDFYNNAGTTDLVVDLTGYYTSTLTPVTDYTYNGDGLRTRKANGLGLQQYVYDASIATPELLDDGASSYIYGNDGEVLAQIKRTGTTEYYVHDNIGSTRLLLINTGSVGASFAYSSYGVLTARAGTSSTPILFAGGYSDSETSLYYLINRYYEPSSGEFLSVDPLLQATGMPYSYAGADPIDASDPSGLSWYNPTSWSKKTWENIGTGAAVVGVVAGGALLCVATACIGDLAVAGGATTLAGTLGVAETAGDIAAGAATVSGVVGGAADVAAVAKDGCVGKRWDSTECLLDYGGVGLDLATLGGAHFIDDYSIWGPVYQTATSAVGLGYGAIKSAIVGGGERKC